MATWKFTYDGIEGVAESYPAGARPAGIWISYYGYGFHLADVIVEPDFIAAVMAAKPE